MGQSPIASSGLMANQKPQNLSHSQRWLSISSDGVGEPSQFCEEVAPKLRMQRWNWPVRRVVTGNEGMHASWDAFRILQTVHIGASMLLAADGTMALPGSESAKRSEPQLVKLIKTRRPLPPAARRNSCAGVPHLANVLPSAAGHKLFAFEQAIPIPPYLIALAVGQLEARDLSARCRVWSEPSMVDAGAYEFADTERFLAAGEAVAGEYVWGRYDLLLLPPSFPYGGMENPCMTFVTPTLLAGDRSLTNVVVRAPARFVPDAWGASGCWWGWSSPTSVRVLDMPCVLFWGRGAYLTHV
eukprot:362014-Chlamydomonas_euryale.AAC.6